MACEVVKLAGGPSARVGVVFLHGFMGAAEDWRGVAERLDGFAHVVGVTYGADDGDDDFSASAERLYADLAREWPGAGFPDKVVLAGYSMGGRIATYLALRQPERFAGVLVESATPGIADAEARSARYRHDRALARELRALENETAFRQFLEGWYSRPPFETLNADQRASLIEKRLAQAPEQLAMDLTAFSVGTQPDLWPELDSLRIPMLVVCGELDHKYRRIAEDMAARTDRIAMQDIAGAGHNVHFEQPGAYTTVLRGFLDSVL